MPSIKTRYILICFLIALSAIVTAACTQTSTEPMPAAPSAQTQNPAAPAPKIVISATTIPVKSFFDMKGSGFTPKADLYSHLKRPNGTEYPVIQMLSDDKGEFTHEIDTLLLQIGTHELWVIDAKSGAASNVAKFEVIRN
jgi:hypothetical protein